MYKLRVRYITKGDEALKQYVVSVSSEGFDLKYYQTTTQCEDDFASFYGVFVEKYVNGSIEEEMDSGPISEDVSYVDEIINKLAENTVTPFFLNEIIDEIV